MTTLKMKTTTETTRDALPHFCSQVFRQQQQQRSNSSFSSFSSAHLLPKSNPLSQASRISGDH
jgi:hypothetical protein